MGIGARVDTDTVDLNGSPEVNFPPRVILACGMRGGFVVKVTIWIAIDSKLCRPTVVCRALGCGFTNGDVLAARYDFNFGEHQEGCSPRLRDSYETCSLRSAGCGLCWPRCKLGFGILDAGIELGGKLTPAWRRYCE